MKTFEELDLIASVQRARAHGSHETPTPIQVRTLNRGAHILFATPVRLLDLMNQGHIKLDQLEVFVLDEADRTLDMGFLPDLKRIISELRKRQQALYFSLTLRPTITELSRRLLRNAACVDATPKSTGVKRIEQRVVFVERTRKPALLRKVFMAAGVDRALVFTWKKRDAQNVAQRLARSGIKATAIDGNKSQCARQRALVVFQRQQVKVLVPTDIAARGINVDGTTHVVNFDLPSEPGSYVHRIDRTGRAGAEGIALSFDSASERLEMRAIETLIGAEIQDNTSNSGVRKRSWATALVRFAS